MKYLINLMSSKVLGSMVVVFFTSILVITGCGQDFLKPEPKSFFTPNQVLTNKEGVNGLLVNLNKMLRYEYYNPFLQLILTEYALSDIAIYSSPTWPHDMKTQLTPTHDGELSTRGYWKHAYEAISKANMLIASVDNVTNWDDEQGKKAMLAAGYFHRAYWYYRLVHQFGNVPVVLKPVKKPRLNFTTFKRKAILKKIRNDMEFAVQHLPITVQPGDISRAAGYYLLTKIYLSLTQFQDAVDAASHVIESGRYHLMWERFGSGRYAGNPRFNVLWDLHQKQNKSIPANTETILVVQDDYNIKGNVSGGTRLLYLIGPKWWDGAVKDPNGFHATIDGPKGNPFSDSLGRGDGDLRTVDYFNYTLWNCNCGDLRHSDVNWFSMDEFIYNNPESEYYGEPFVRKYIGDTTRTWYPFMYNKLYVVDKIREHRKRGGHSDWYVYRLAGLYLLRAEAYFWLGNMTKAAADINKVRKRAQATPIGSGEVTIDYIFDERARELWLEEPRKTELTRVAYIMAQLGRRGYSIENMYKDNWYYDRVMKTNIYYREHILFGTNRYIIKPYHVYWPIPQSEIDSNVKGYINQTPGYNGWESNKKPLGFEDLQELMQK